MYAIIYFLTLCMGIVGSGGGVFAVISHLRRESGQESDETLKEDLLLPIVLLAGAIYLLLLACSVT